jgi:GTP cyclohydrolase III
MAKQRYRFTVEMAGVGETPEDAWEDAVECFTGEASVTAVDLDHDQEDLV